jgi:2'-5' RNA ligase
MMRLFVALDLPEAVRARLAMLQSGVPGARWVAQENLHLTVRFLGEVDTGTAHDLDAELARVDAPAFDFGLSAVSFFGPERKPQVLWAGVDRAEPLQFLHAKVNRAAVAAGLPADDRKFHPHVTLARLRDTPMRRVRDWLSGNALFQAGPIEADRFVLFRSHLGKEGPAYEPLAEYALVR